MSQIILKKSNVSAKVPAVSDLAYGELALNYADGKLYYRTPSDTISSISSGGGSGTAGTISIGTVTTGAAGSSVQITNSGTSSAAVLNFTIPQGATGATGPTVYPAVGIAYSTGTAWGTSLTAPTGTIVGTSDTQTLTNKRITQRVQSQTVASGSTTQTWSSDSYDQVNLTLSNTATVTLSLDSGTPVDGQKIMFRLKDDGTSRTFAFTSTGTNCFRNAGTSVTLSGTATTASKLNYIGCIYNSSGTGTWDIVAFGQEA